MEYQAIIKQIQHLTFEKIYFLHGEESYFTDLIEASVINYALDDSERDFNQTIVYGKDCTGDQLLSYLREFPMMAQRRLVVLREAQQFRDLDVLTEYAQQPNASTILVISYKHGTYDARKRLLKEVAQNGLVFKSDRLKEKGIESFAEAYLKERGYRISHKAIYLLSEFLGTDLSKLINEIDKLCLLVAQGTEINEVHIEENIGISKDYNVFELTNAIGIRDQVKVFRILKYFEHNPKAGEPVLILGTLYSQFERLLRLQFAENKDPNYLAGLLGMNRYAVIKLLETARIYPPKKVAANITLLHQYDLKTKGVGSSSTDRIAPLYELVYQLMN